ncbi:1-deoxy-D-xylulose-5-phosphate synthase [Lacticaseibacillus daqingensis]|uniref:1-deoxy-D-xylulose-5-phosphate synthase n=1 Tax=Lacticaseibacillus daqingensis TaxID=2486014 RepID=UPI000F772220|nr:1-deoxy-D-xylulose-5-phosphate synthase [Lacticaseibacillus daqingensis]
MLLEQIDSPKDLKQLPAAQLPALAQEIRQVLLNKVSVTGGHVGPNLGVVELTIAFHRVFDSPTDKVVWDVSHQSYPHKILTGRKQAWLDPAHYEDVSGFTAPEESPHDFFTIGHTSTSIGLATGMALARDHRHEPGNIVAVIGDGSLSGGLAFEALNNAAVLAHNLIIVVNDNGMSIAENHGGLYANLKLLRDTNGQAELNFFKAMGLDYRYEPNGNDVAAMTAAFTAVKDTDHPVVLHVHTEKGLGYAPAVADKEQWHWHVPFDLATAQPLRPRTGVSYLGLIRAQLAARIAAHNAPIYAINAAIPGSFGLKDFAAQYPERYIDVGIAEQESITLAAGMAQQGLRPVVFHSGTFLQRAYDQLSHDLGINRLPAVLILTGGAVSGGDPTHQGTFDIPMLANIPNLTYLTPTTQEELTAQLDWALTQTAGPVAIRVPAHGVQSAPLDPAFAPLTPHVLHQGQTVALLALGSMLPTAQTVATQLLAHGIDATLVDPRSANAWQAADLLPLGTAHRLIVTLEEGSLDGGFGQKVAALFGPTATRVLPFGAKRQFNARETTQALLQRDQLTPDLITTAILAQL